MGDGSMPTIDLQEFPGQYEKLREACEEWGCFRIMNHKVPLPVLNDMKQVVKSLFDLPFEIKSRNSDVIVESGYMAASQTNPFYEALGLYNMESTPAVDSFCSQLGVSPSQREIIEMYTKTTHELAMDIAQKIAESLGLSSDVFKEWPSNSRLNKYNFSFESVGFTGLQVHTDTGFITILREDENVPGLEVMDKSGSFMAVKPIPGTFVVLLGDMAKAWSNGRFRNVKHRVQCKEAKERVSIITFLSGPKQGGAVEAPPELVDSQHPRLYKPVTFEEYQKLRTSTGLRTGEPLEFIRA